MRSASQINEPIVSPAPFSGLSMSKIKTLLVKRAQGTLLNTLSGKRILKKIGYIYICVCLTDSLFCTAETQHFTSTILQKFF